MYLRLLVATGSALFILGCKPTMDDPAKAALSNPDPWDALVNYEAQIRDAESERGFLDPKIYVDQSLTTKLLKQSLDLSIPGAYERLFTNYRNVPYENIQSFSAEYAPKLLKLADAATGEKPDDFRILRLAGYVVSEGRYVQQNTPQSVAYLSRAWAAGSVDAPRNLADIFDKNHDTANAYLWSIRCLNDCRSGGNQYDEFRMSLSNRQILKIEEAAADKSILTVNASQLADN